MIAGRIGRIALAVVAVLALAVVVFLEGANHAAFGDYGPQPGDGISTASDEVTRDRITAAVAEFLAPPAS